MSLQEAKRAFEIAKSNLAFAQASKSEKRVIIAKDVIASIKAKVIAPERGVYLEVSDGDLHARKIDECQACALGSVFVCALKRDSKIEATRYPGDDEEWAEDQSEMQERLAPYFDVEQLSLIEEAFEVEKGERRASKYDSLFQKAEVFGSRFSTSKGRLIAIMENIIENKGTFKP